MAALASQLALGLPLHSPPPPSKATMPTEHSHGLLGVLNPRLQDCVPSAEGLSHLPGPSSVPHDSMAQTRTQQACLCGQPGAVLVIIIIIIILSAPPLLHPAPLEKKVRTLAFEASGWRHRSPGVLTSPHGPFWWQRTPNAVSSPRSAPRIKLTPPRTPLPLSGKA